MGTFSSLGGSIGGYFGSKKEARGYGNAQDEMEKLKKEATTTQEKIDPYSEYRQRAADDLYGYITGSKSIQTDPGYKFAFDQGQEAVSRAAAQRGLNTSGNVMAALQARGQDVANQQYSSIIARLTELAGATAGNAAAGGQAYGNIITSALTGSANAEIGKAAANSRANVALHTGIGKGIDAAMSYGMSGYMDQMGGMMGGGGGGGGGTATSGGNFSTQSSAGQGWDVSSFFN